MKCSHLCKKQHYGPDCTGSKWGELVFDPSALTFALLSCYILVLPSAMLSHLSITRSQRAKLHVAFPSAEMAVWLSCCWASLSEQDTGSSTRSAWSRHVHFFFKRRLLVKNLQCVRAQLKLESAESSDWMSGKIMKKKRHCLCLLCWVALMVSFNHASPRRTRCTLPLLLHLAMTSPHKHFQEQ